LPFFADDLTSTCEKLQNELKKASEEGSSAKNLVTKAEADLEILRQKSESLKEQSHDSKLKVTLAP